MKVAKQTKIALCPECSEEIDFSQTSPPKVGLKFPCPNCDTYLEVVSVNPLELSWDDGAYDDDYWDGDEED